MGVKGLTTYIAKKAEKYLKPFELHDCALVIDGDSLASNLYQWSSDCNSAFGGDYDLYYRVVVDFFTRLRRCNVRAFVLLDGGYQRRKLRTVQERLRGKIGAIKRINPIDGHHLFPLMMREVFVDALRSSPGVKFMRCLFEADDEVAMLARQLNCPVLSYDSDFYIHNVQYIPSVTLTMKVLRKTAPRKNRRKPAATSQAAAAAFKPYNYLDCCVYTIANLAGTGIRDEVLPLFGTLLGNDYINRVVFKKFFANISRKHIGKRNSPQQKRIISLLRWLQNETLETALAKVLDRVEKEKRGWLKKEIDQAMAGYVRADSKAFAYFGLTESDIQTTDVSDFISENDDETTTTEEDESDDDAECLSEDDEAADVLYDSDGDNDTSTERTYQESTSGSAFQAPEWLLPRIFAAELPRYAVDLLSLRMYINSPQVEHFALPESNEVALPILQFIFTLLHHPNQPTEFQYLTRMQRVSNVHFKTVEALDRTSLPFSPTDATANLEVFRLLFVNTPTVIEVALELDEPVRLFYLSVVYTAQNSKQLSLAHLHSLAIALCVLDTAEELCPGAPRDPSEFHKKFGNILAVTADDGRLNVNAAVRLQRNALPFFQLNPKIRSKHTEFSSTTVHGFAELQATLFHMNALNAILGRPFAATRVARVSNGSLWYNLVIGLQSRADIGHYVRQHVFHDCRGFVDIYQLFIEALRLFVKCLDTAPKVTRKMTRNRRKREKKVQKQQQSQEVIAANNGVVVDVLETDEVNAQVFNDVNNSFSGLTLDG